MSGLPCIHFQPMAPLSLQGGNGIWRAVLNIVEWLSEIALHVPLLMLGPKNEKYWSVLSYSNASYIAPNFS